MYFFNLLENTHCKLWNIFHWKSTRKIFNFIQHGGCYSTQPYFVTTPIFYVNAAPHIGHLQSCLYADVFHRIHQLLGEATIFSTGTDEHGLKIQQAADSAGKTPLGLCTEISQQFRSTFEKADVSYTHFIRTTDEKHLRAVKHFWEKLRANGHIYKGQYEGWYNVSDETFVAPSQIKEIKDVSGSKMVCAASGNLLEKMQEENYIFALSKFKDDLLYWLSKDVIKPKIFVNDVKLWINGMNDLSVSRQRSRLPWGIPVPGDTTQTIYVWLDALVNYLTVGGYPDDKMSWPISCHVIGKDILKFHAIYWPAFLIAAGFEPPRSIFCHSHWTVDYEKMSKSKGNVVDPLDLIEKYGCDGFRYFLLRAAIPDSDSNYSETKIFRLLNAELADTLGNLLSRSCAHAVNKEQIFPPFSDEAFKLISNESVKELIKFASLLPEITQEKFLKGDLFHGLETIMECLRKTNAFMQSQKPWELVKDESSTAKNKLNTVLHIVLEVLRISGLLLQPIIPSMSACLLDKLGLDAEERNWKSFNCFPSLNGATNRLEGKILGVNNNVLFVRRKAPK